MKKSAWNAELKTVHVCVLGLSDSIDFSIIAIVKLLSR